MQMFQSAENLSNTSEKLAF